MDRPLLSAGPADYAVIIAYVLFVIGIGAVIGRNTKTSTDFFLSGRRIPAWVTGLAFISANLGAVEVLGMASSGAKYGLMTAHYYWVGAIPAMVFLAVFMMPFYYGSKVRSVPEYLKRRYNEPTRFINAITFAVSTLILSGVNMYAMGLVCHDLLGWNMVTSIWVSALVVVAYTYVGGLTSSIYNEVLQFFLIVLGITPLVVLGLIDAGGWSGLHQHLAASYFHTWQGTGHASTNMMQITWPGIVLGLGFVLSFGYWCTDFLVVQRALSAKDLPAAQDTPLIAAVPKLIFPFIVILPGLLAVPLLPGLGQGTDPAHSYNNALPLLMAKYYPTGMLGLGITALLASFMSGMAGNVTAFNTVFTYDLYSVFIAKNRDDRHYLMVGRIMTVVGVVVSVLTAFLAAKAPTIMDYMQAVFGFVNAPLLVAFLFGMFWKRTTAWGGFYGLVAGILAAVTHFVATHNSVSTTDNFVRAGIAFGVGSLVTVVVSLLTAPKTHEELEGLVYGQAAETLAHRGLPWFKRPAVLGAIIIAATVVLNILFW